MNSPARRPALTGVFSSEVSFALGGLAVHIRHRMLEVVLKAES